MRSAVMLAVLITLFGAVAAHAGESHMKTPKSLAVEHHEIHEELLALTKAPGRTGEAARALADTLHPHFVAEEEFAMPPLGALLPLARGGNVEHRDEIIAMSRKLRADYTKMLDEHKAIRAKVEALAEAGTADGNAAATAFAEKLANHALTEEEILYPAAMLVGELLERKTSQKE